MRFTRVIGVLCLLALSLLASAQTRQNDRAQVRPSKTLVLSAKEILQHESRAIVFVESLDAKGKVYAFGTGFIVRSNGVVLTNFHVIEGAQGAQIRLKNGEVYDDAKVLDYSQRRDIAVLKVRALDLPTVSLGDSDKAEAGDVAYAIGNPEGLEQTISNGIISGRRVLEGTQWIQTTVPISHGSSGGPLYNSRGEVIGLTTFHIKDAQNLNFATPIKYALEMLEGNPTPMTIADVTAKTGKPAAKETSSGSSGGGSSGGGSSSGGSTAPASTGTDYNEPTGVLTVTVPTGWTAEPGSDPQHDRLLRVRKGGTWLDIYQRHFANEEMSAVFKLADEAMGKSSDWTKTAEPSQLLSSTLDNGVAYMLRWQHYRFKDNVEYYLLVGVMWTKRAHFMIFCYLPSAEEQANLNDAVAAVFSMR